MKRILLVIFSFSFAICAQSQKGSNYLFELVKNTRASIKTNEVVRLFTLAAQSTGQQVDKTVSEKTILHLDRNLSTRLFTERPASITFILPTRNGEIALELIQQNINATEDFVFGSITGSGTMKQESSEQGLHYRGYVSGDANSLASVSIFENGELMGLFSNEQGNNNIGNIGGSRDYILYNNYKVTVPLSFECGADALPDVPGANFKGITDVMRDPEPSAVPPELLCRKVRIYWEADYKLYANNFGSNLNDTRNYLVGLFNQVATMYLNEGIMIELSESFVWTTPDPYNTASSSEGLASFKNRWNDLENIFKGDLAVLIDGAPTNNGGIAYLLTNNLCNRSFAYGYANVYGYYNTVPTYSWDVEVVTHEMGHMMGSKHTHWCGWNTGANNTCGAIDNCYSVEAVTSVCTTCSATTNTNPSAPFGFKGSVMSYCHLRSGIGINLANGFGPLPQAAIRTTVTIATCALRDNKWTGEVSTAWENPANWGCGTIPDINTDVTISSGLLRYPVINSAAVCRRLVQAPSSSVTVKTGFTLKVAGPPSNP